MAQCTCLLISPSRFHRSIAYFTSALLETPRDRTGFILERVRQREECLPLFFPEGSNLLRDGVTKLLLRVPASRHPEQWGFGENARAFVDRRCCDKVMAFARDLLDNVINGHRLCFVSRRGLLLLLLMYIDNLLMYKLNLFDRTRCHC